MEDKGSSLPGIALLSLLLFSFFFMGYRKVPADAGGSTISQSATSAAPPSPTTQSEMTAGPPPASEPVEIPALSRATLLPPATPISTPLLPPATRRPLAQHTVEAGETLSAIAGRYGATVEMLQKMNGVVDPHALFVGQLLLIPSTLQENEEAARTSAYSVVTVGTSANGYPIESFVLGDGEMDVVVIGAIHGGYEWNTALLAYRLLAYFSAFGEALPAGISLHVIPIANPDGVAAVTGRPGPFTALDISGDTSIGRLNGNGVDLNRNWDCDWTATGQWRDSQVSGGSQPFSEPETQALRDYLTQGGIDVVIWLHSAAGLVIPASCGGETNQSSEVAAVLYAGLAGYPTGGFDAYPVTGDAASWLSRQGIASFTVELSNHQDIEFDRNVSGLLSLFEGFQAME